MKRTGLDKPLTCLLALSALMCGSAAQAQIATTAKISSPVIVADHAQMTAGADLAGTQMDAPVATFVRANGDRYWITSQWIRDTPPGGISHSLHQGGLDAPYATTLWTRPTCYKTNGMFCAAGTHPGHLFTRVLPSDVVSLWITSVYQVPGGDGDELLAFVHEERAGWTGGTPENPEGKTRIGLARSTDAGQSWTYLGRILIAHGDPAKHNVQGTPYVVKDGYLYVYYTDALIDGSGQKTGELIATARASIDSVVAAARADSVGDNLWRKFSAPGGDGFETPGGGSFVSFGLGGNAGGNGLWGITHTQAAYSTHTGKYYLPLTFLSWDPGNTGQWINSSVKIYESTDAVTWSPSPAFVVADEAGATLRHTGGYQYCSIADSAGQGNAVVGQRFYLYCMKDPIIEAQYGGGAGVRNFALYRWQVNLGASVDTFRQSVDFTLTQGPYWVYQRGDGSGLFDMLPQSSYWAGTQAYNHIYSDAMHPGISEMPVLKWIAPRAGTVRIEGTARSANPLLLGDGTPACGDGVAVAVMHNGSSLFNAQIGAADTVGKSINTTRPVAAGDGLFFIVAPGANNYCDNTRFDPSVTYLP